MEINHESPTYFVWKTSQVNICKLVTMGIFGLDVRQIQRCAESGPNGWIQFLLLFVFYLAQWDLWWTRWHWDSFSSDHFCSFCQYPPFRNTFNMLQDRRTKLQQGTFKKQMLVENRGAWDRTWNGLIWPWIKTSDGLLRTESLTSISEKTTGNFSPSSYRVWKCMANSVRYCCKVAEVYVALAVAVCSSLCPQMARRC